MNQEYIKFLESFINAEDLAEFFNTALNIFRKTFHASRCQIWKTSSLIQGYLVEHESPDTTNNSMLKLNISLPQNITTESIRNKVIFSTQNLKDNQLNKFDIHALIGTELNLNGEKKVFLILTSSNKEYHLNKEELNSLSQFANKLELAARKITLHTKSISEARRLKEQNTQLIERDNQRTKFINNVAHELKTPLASILGFSNFLISKPPSSKHSFKELAEQIIQAANRLSDQITNFLQINKLDSGYWDATIESCDIGELIKKSTEEFSSLDKKHKINCSIPDTYPTIHTDPKLIRQVLDNLISNSIKYSPDGGSIIVSLSSKDNKVKISVKDEGTGIPDGELDKIFNRFYRSPNPNLKNASGSGLGLSICKEIIDVLDGKIEVKSEQGKGSLFSVTLPV